MTFKTSNPESISMANFSLRKLNPGDVALARELFVLFQEVFSEGDESLKKPLPSNDHLARMIAKDDFHFIVALYDDVIMMTSS